MTLIGQVKSAFLLYQQHLANFSPGAPVISKAFWPEIFGRLPVLWGCHIKFILLYLNLDRNWRSRNKINRFGSIFQLTPLFDYMPFFTQQGFFVVLNVISYLNAHIQTPILIYIRNLRPI